MVDGFFTELVTTTDPENMPFVLLSCDGSPIKLEVLQPIRAEEGGPVLKEKPESYFIYEGKTYSNGTSLLVSEEFQNREVRIGVTLKNRGNKLTAGQYIYNVTLRLSSTVSDF